MALLLDGFPFSLISFNDETDPKPGVRGCRAAVVLRGGFDTPAGGFEMDGVLFAAPVMEARGRTGDLTVPGSGEALDGGLLIAETGDFETDGERGGLEAVDDDNGFLSAEGWTLGGRTDVLRAWAGTEGFAGCIAAFVVGVGAFFTGEAVGEGLTPGAVTLGLLAPAT